MILFETVTKEFQLGAETSISPVKQANLDVSEGEFIIIIGRSGSGKTTLLNLAAGMVKPTLGRVLVNKIDLSAMTDKELSALRSHYLGFVFQFPSLLPSLTVLENVALPAIFCNHVRKKDADQRAEQLLNTMGLTAKLDVFPKQLSAGEQKRVVIARSMINSPKVILADEPTSDLDSQTEIEVMNLLKEINAGGVTFMVVTHNLQLVAYATRAFNMENGTLIQVG